MALARSFFGTFRHLNRPNLTAAGFFGALFEDSSIPPNLVYDRMQVNYVPLRFHGSTGSSGINARLRRSVRQFLHINMMNWDVGN